MPGIAELLAQRLDLRRDDAEILGDDRAADPSASVMALNSAAPGPFTHRPFTAVVSAPGTSQYASKPRK